MSFSGKLAAHVSIQNHIDLPSPTTRRIQWDSRTLEASKSDPVITIVSHVPGAAVFI
ncbi:hypothetical protein Hanom_Chr15g01353481 [Helianthus anomalus]